MAGSDPRNVTVPALILGLVVLVSLGVASRVLASTGGPRTPPDRIVLAQTEGEGSPYEPPDFEQVEPGFWSDRFEVFTRLPLWMTAAILSAGVAGLALVAPMVARWLWNLGSEEQEGRRE